MRTARRATNNLPIVLSLAGAGVAVLVIAGAVAALVVLFSPAPNPEQPADAPRGDAGARKPLVPPVVNNPNPNPTAGKEGLEWGLRDLAEYLKAKGVIISYELPAKESVEAFGRVVKQPMLVKNVKGQTVEVRRHDGAISAEEQMNSYEYRRHYASYAWGAFSAIPARGEASVTPVFGKLPGVKCSQD